MNRITRLRLPIILLLLVMMASSSMTYAADFDTTNYRKTLIQLLAATFDEARGRPSDLAIYDAIAESGDALYIAPLIDLAYFARSEALNRAVITALNGLTGKDMDWRGYFEWAGRDDIALPPAYAEFKGQVLAAFVDAEFLRFFAPGVLGTAKINLVEAVWGGVTVDGIPSLVNARQISPQDAVTEGYEYEDFCRDFDCSYPAADELVFGLSLHGDSRAYPLRLLNWHEMFNDVIGQAPMYDAPDGERVCNFRAPTILWRSGARTRIGYSSKANPQPARAVAGCKLMALNGKATPRTGGACRISARAKKRRKTDWLAESGDARLCWLIVRFVARAYYTMCKLTI